VDRGSLSVWGRTGRDSGLRSTRLPCRAPASCVRAPRGVGRGTENLQFNFHSLYTNYEPNRYRMPTPAIRHFIYATMMQRQRTPSHPDAIRRDSDTIPSRLCCGHVHEPVSHGPKCKEPGMTKLPRSTPSPTPLGSPSGRCRPRWPWRARRLRGSRSRCSTCSSSTSGKRRRLRRCRRRPSHRSRRE
jgi:hypothetical protein